MKYTPGLMLLSFCFGIGFTAIVVDSIPAKRVGCIVPHAYKTSGKYEQVVAVVSEEALPMSRGLLAVKNCEDGTYLSLLMAEEKDFQ